jgi:K319-like protein
MKSLRLLSILLLFLVSCNRDEDILLNVVPTADAGSPKSITLPVNTVTLTGTGADSDGTIVAYVWSQVSGPSSTIIVHPGSPTTAVNGFIAGTYKFQLGVTDDDGATGFDTVSVIVSQAAQTTITLQPTNNPTETRIAILGTGDWSAPGPDIPLAAWTVGGTPVTIRELLKFDWGAIPQNATIVSATLTLYSYPAPTLNGNLTDANFGTNNSFTIQRITTDWSVATATWFNQPAGASTNQVVIPHTASSVLDVNADVTNLVSTMVSTNANYGFLLKLQNETIYTSRIFVSSSSTVHPTKRPKLVIVYR